MFLQHDKFSITKNTPKTSNFLDKKDTVSFEPRHYVRRYSSIVPPNKSKIMPDSNDDTNDVICPCCIRALDLDEASSLAKVSSSIKKHHIVFNKMGHLPQSPVEILTTSLSSLFALTGVCFGAYNIYNSSRDLKKLSHIILDLKTKIVKFEADKTATTHEMKNLKTYLKILLHLEDDLKNHKYVGGLTPLLGSATMMGSLIYSPLSIPALGIMTLYSAMYMNHYIKQNRHINNIDFSKIDKCTNIYEKQGEKVFKSRLKKISMFNKKLIGSWGLYGSGTSLLLASAITITAGTFFPPALLFSGVGFLVSGIVNTLYFNNRISKKLDPKHEQRINRQFLGKKSDIFLMLGMNDSLLKLVKNYKRDIHKIIGYKLPFKSLKHKAYVTTNHLLTSISFGALVSFRKKNHTLKEEYLSNAQHKDIFNSTSEVRNMFLRKHLQQQINYLHFLKSSTETLDASVFKPYTENITTTYQNDMISTELLKNSFMNYLEESIAKRSLIHDSILHNSNNSTMQFVNAWKFLSDNKLLDKTVRKMHTLLVKDNSIKELIDSKLITLEKNTIDTQSKSNLFSYIKNKFFKHKSVHSNFYIEKNRLLHEIQKDNPSAIKLVNKFLQCLDHSIMYDLRDEYKYINSELCSHIIERLQK